MTNINVLARALVLGLFTLLPLQSNAADSDFAGPLVTIASHQNGQIVNTRTIVLTGTATDAGRGNNGISSVYARGQAEGGTATGSGTATWSQSITLNPGANYIEVSAYDASANRNYTAQQITINFQPLDSLPPSISVTSHVNGQTVNTREISLAGTATDAGNGDNGISSVYVRGSIPGATAAGAATAAWSKTIELNPGANYIEISAYDNSDVQNQKVLPLTINFQPVDPLGPTLIVSSHTNGQTVATSSIVIQGTATDAGRGNSGISSVYLRGNIPGTAATGGGTVNWSRTVDLVPGANYLTVYAYDDSDVKNETSQTLTINLQPGDTLAPVLTINTHTNGQTVFTSSITIAGTATDAGRGDHGISSVYLNGKIPDAAGQGAAVVPWSREVQLYPGRNSITVYAYDNTEFPNQATESLIINFQPADTLPPTLSITSHFDGQTVNTRTVEIRGTATDAGRGNSGISAVYLNGKIPDTVATGGDLLSWRRIVELTPGRNVLTVTAYDDAPFPNSSAQTIALNFQPADSSPPALQVTSHADGQVLYTNVVTVTGTASDAGRGDNGIAYVKVNFARAENDTAAGAGVANWSRTFALNPGNNNIYITAADASEFQQETNLTLHLVYQVGDFTAPNLTIDAPRNGATVSTPTVTISGTAADNGAGASGIAGVSLNGLLIPGSTATGSGLVNWSQQITLQRGANVIAVVATDNSANRNSGTGTITVYYEPTDLLAPVVTIESHRNGQTVTTPSITLTGTATDEGNGGNGISSVTVNSARAENDVATGSATARWSKVLNLTPGPNVISVVARDSSPNGNQAAATITVFYDGSDTAGPDIEITSHRREQTVATATITIAGTASDAQHGANGVSAVTVNGQPAQGTASGAATANWSRTLNLQLGVNLISIVATDSKQNSTAATIRIIYEPIDQTPPDIEVTSHKNGQRVGTASILLAGFATDADRGDSGVSGVSVAGTVVADAQAAGAAMTRWAQRIFLKPGENVISIVASDSKENSGAVTITLTYDPEIANNSGAFCWVKGVGASGNDAGYAIALDLAGNSYVAGAFEGAVSLGATNLISRGGSDIFVAKFSPDGLLIWVRQAGGAGPDAAFGVAVSTNGNCFVTGYYSTNALFEAAELSTTGTFDMFLAKYDQDGRLLWAANTGQGAGLLGSAVAVDPQENSYVAGSFAYDAVFGGVQLSNNEKYDGFVAKFDAEGSLVWVNQIGGDSEDRTAAIAVDSQGRAYVSGYFQDQAFFGDQALTSAGVHDMFLCRFEANGTLAWVRQGGGAGQTESAALALDAASNIYVTGYYQSQATFGTNQLATHGFYDLFLTKYDSSGNVLWAKNTRESNAINGNAVGVDNDGSVYLLGRFIGPAQIGTNVLDNTVSSDIFLAKYDADGNPLNIRTAGGETDLDAFALAVSGSGASHITGSSTGTAMFGSNQLVSNSTADLFVAKLSDGVSAAPALLGIERLDPDRVQLQFEGESCANYRLQASANLQQWSTLLSTNGGPVVHIEARAAPYRFFRVVSP